MLVIGFNIVSYLSASTVIFFQISVQVVLNSIKITHISLHLALECV